MWRSPTVISCKTAKTATIIHRKLAILVSETSADFTTESFWAFSYIDIQERTNKKNEKNVTQNAQNDFVVPSSVFLTQRGSAGLGTGSFRRLRTVVTLTLTLASLRTAFLSSLTRYLGLGVSGEGVRAILA